jgi:signal transduction histidine kinase
MKNIELQLNPGTTLTGLGVSTLTTDHVRLGQVVTNLVSNAIRFTAGSPHRLITVTYDVSRTKPEQDTCGLPDEQDNSSTPAATGSPVWLFVSVKDTGPGLSPEELKRLFLRFSRTSKFSNHRWPFQKPVIWFILNTADLDWDCISAKVRTIHAASLLT